MLIIWKFPKSIAGHTRGPRGPLAARGPRVWDPWLTLCYSLHKQC